MAHCASLCVTALCLRVFECASAAASVRLSPLHLCNRSNPPFPLIQGTSRTKSTNQIKVSCAPAKQAVLKEKISINQQQAYSLVTPHSAPQALWILRVSNVGHLSAPPPKISRCAASAPLLLLLRPQLPVMSQSQMSLRQESR